MNTSSHDSRSAAGSPSRRSAKWQRTSQPRRAASASTNSSRRSSTSTTLARRPGAPPARKRPSEVRSWSPTKSTCAPVRSKPSSMNRARLTTVSAVAGTWSSACTGGGAASISSAIAARTSGSRRADSVHGSRTPNGSRAPKLYSSMCRFAMRFPSPDDSRCGSSARNTASTVRRDVPVRETTSSIERNAPRPAAARSGRCAPHRSRNRPAARGRPAARYSSSGGLLHSAWTVRGSDPRFSARKQRRAARAGSPAAVVTPPRRPAGPGGCGSRVRRRCRRCSRPDGSGPGPPRRWLGPPCPCSRLARRS